jgi:membrane protein
VERREPERGRIERAQKRALGVEAQAASALRSGEERLERHPASLPAVAVDALRSSARDRITTSAASLAFHWALAIFPAALGGVAIAHLAGISSSAMTTLIHDLAVVLPSSAVAVLAGALRSSSSRTASTVEVVSGLGVALWSAIEAMAALQVGLDIAFAVRRDRGFLARRLRALPLLGAMVVLGGAAFALVVLGHPIGELIHRSLPGVGSVFDLAWTVLAWVGALVLVTLLLAVLYAFGPNRSRPLGRLVTPGSALATLGWVVASLAYSVYLRDFGHASRDYGALAGVAVLLLWLFLTALLLLVGAELDRALEAARRPEAVP